MKFLWDSALGLLIITGALLGLSLPFGKVATAAGVPGIVWAFVISLGAGGVLLLSLLLHGRRIKLTAHKLRYFLVVAAVSYAGPNLLMFSAISHLGAGYTGIMFTLSPVITLVFSILLGVRRPNTLGIVGIAVGFVGAVMVAATRGEAGQPAEFFWVFLGLLVPVSLAVGNIYRTVDWPEGTGPIELAVGSHLAAAAMLLGGILLLQGGDALGPLAGVPLVVAAQVASAAAMFAFFFRLQAVGGPVYLSQIGYVAAAVGLFSGTLLLGERYQALTWAGAAIVTAGVSSRRKRKSWSHRTPGCLSSCILWLYTDTQSGIHGGSMAFHIKNPETDALARRVAALKNVGLTEAVHEALQRELERERAKPSLVEISAAFARELRAKGDPSKALPADKAFIDSLYED